MNTVLKNLLMLVVMFCVADILAVPFHPVALPVVAHIDTEVTTNVSITAWQNRAAPAWLYGRDWNLMRLTGRGLDASGETFTIGTPSDPTAIIFR